MIDNRDITMVMLIYENVMESSCISLSVRKKPRVGHISNLLIVPDILNCTKPFIIPLFVP